MDYSSDEFLLILSTIVVLLLLLVAHLGRPSSVYDVSYTYLVRGPTTWKNNFLDTIGDQKSPINIDSNYAIVLPAETLTPLWFSHEHHFPCDLRLYSDGHCVTLCARRKDECMDNYPPVISNGCLKNDYEFVNLRFRWGPNDNEGSKHTVDSQMYAMELQATYVKSINQSAEENNSIVIISYFYQLVFVDNPCLTPIIKKLKLIKCPSDTVDLEPLALSSLIPPFHRKYYTYNGSLTYPPCTEGVIWIIQSKPLGISARQVREFRKMGAIWGRMERNTRPVQNVNSPELYFYD